MAKKRIWKSRNFIACLCGLILSSAGYSAEWYVSSSGLDQNSGSSVTTPFKTISKGVGVTSPGDTVYVMDGTYRNAGYGSGLDGTDYRNSVVVRLTQSGEAGAPITLRNLQGHTPKIQFDGAGGINLSANVNHVVIEGFEIEGPSASITYAQAIADRNYKIEVAGDGDDATRYRHTYFSGKGIWGYGPHHHVVVRNNIVHDTPGSGIRFNDSDYMTIESNTVYNTTWWTSSASSAIVYAEAISAVGDNGTGVKMVMRGNVLYNNWNRIPFYVTQLPDNASGPGGDYGTASQNNILDGQGLYVTRSDPSYAGTFLFENNLVVNSGKNGIHFDHSHAASGIIRNNTLFFNGVHNIIQNLSVEEGNPRHIGNNKVAGINTRSVASVAVVNNIVVTRDNQYSALGLYDIPGQNQIVSNNIFSNGSIIPSGTGGYSNESPKFINAPEVVNGLIDMSGTDFSLATDSPAINAGNPNYSPVNDLKGDLRPVRSEAITSSSFENSDDGWVPFGAAVQRSSVEALTGTHSLLVSERGYNYSSARLYLDGLLTVGKTYTLSAWVRLAEGASGTTQATLKRELGDAAPDYTEWTAAVTARDDRWVQITGDYTHLASDRIFVYIKGPQSGDGLNGYYIDDVSIVEQGVSPVDFDDVGDVVDVGAYEYQSSDNAPVFTSEAAFSVPENQTAIATVTATDVDSASISFSITGTELEITQTGVLSFLDAPDYEQKTRYTATVTATDGRNSQGQIITVSVTDVDDESPVFTSASVLSAAENQTAITTVTVTDTDSATHEFSISESGLAISPLGVLTFVTAPDYEEQSSYTARITATDGFNTAFQDITVSVLDVDELMDADADGVADGVDNCVYAVNPNQLDTDADNIGNLCDDDDDGDGVTDTQEAAEGTDPLDSTDCFSCLNPLSGRVYHWKSHAFLDATELNLEGVADDIAAPFVAQAVSDQTGHYTFSDMHHGANHMMASRAITAPESGNVVSSADALAALKIAVGVNPNADPDGAGPLNPLAISPYQYVAADVNGDGLITSADALAILKMAVKLGTAQPRRWVFVAEDYDFWDDANERFKTRRGDVTWDRDGIVFEYPKSKQNLVGVLMGDVNGDWKAPEDSDTLAKEHFVEFVAAHGGNLAQWNIFNTPPRLSVNPAVVVPENQTAVMLATATDAEQDTLSYSLVGPDAAVFDVSGSGEVIFLAAPDFENPVDADADNIFMFSVIVTDSEGLTDSVELTVTVTDVDENLPPSLPLSEIKTLTQSIDGQLVERRYIIRYPQDIAKRSYPVVFFFHGSGGAADSWLLNPAVSRLIDEGEFVGIFPDGYNKRWNVGTESNADDVAFVTEIVNSLPPEGVFDLEKMYGVGTSNGAGLVNKLAKETTLFKGIAPLISQQTVAIGNVVPSQSISVFQVNGSEDSLIPLEGGAGVANHVFMSAQESSEDWASHFNCNMTPTVRSLRWGNYDVQENTFNNCLGGQRVRYFVAEGAGHSLNFGSDVDIYREAWNFFKAADPDYYVQFMGGMSLSSSQKTQFMVNGQRFQEICLDNFVGLKNPLWSIYQTGQWPIYFHIESWEGSVTSEAISQMRADYQLIANQWIADLQEYDSSFDRQAEVKIFGFVFNSGVTTDDTFTDVFGGYPQVYNYSGTNERSPWEVSYREGDAVFSQNWYTLDDFSRVKVNGNGNNNSGVVYYPESWTGYQHPENVDHFLTKFWHKTSWDAVAQRQYLKLGGNVTDYQRGETRYTVFAHEMGHTFFLDDIYSAGKYPDRGSLSSIMNNASSITDFDVFSLRMAWKQQKELH